MRIALFAVALLVSGALHAQSWPSKPLRWIVPYPPGGSTDIAARVVADRVGQALGQSVVVENRSGAAGNIGFEAASKSAADGYTIAYYAPEPRAVVEIVDFEDSNKIVPYGQTGRVKLYTMTKEFFVPGFLERDEGERELPYSKYPWDGVSGVRPYRGFASSTTVGVY